jgi:hypothetical protein
MIDIKPALNWQKKESASRCIFSANCSDSDELLIAKVIGETIEQAILNLGRNFNNDSMFLLFEWDKDTSTLTVVVTDQAKQYDSNIVVECKFNALAEMELQADQLADNIHYWIKDYLTTCDSFFQYSLVAVFHAEQRSKAVLL